MKIHTIWRTCYQCCDILPIFNSPTTEQACKLVNCTICMFEIWKSYIETLSSWTHGLVHKRNIEVDHVYSRLINNHKNTSSVCDLTKQHRNVLKFNCGFYLEYMYAIWVNSRFNQCKFKDLVLTSFFLRKEILQSAFATKYTVITLRRHRFINIWKDGRQIREKCFAVVFSSEI